MGCFHWVIIGERQHLYTQRNFFDCHYVCRNMIAPTKAGSTGYTDSRDHIIDLQLHGKQNSESKISLVAIKIYMLYLTLLLLISLN